MKSRKLVLGLLIMLAFVVSSFTYAYWANTSFADSAIDNTVNIGQGREASVAATTAGVTGFELVPNGQIGNSVLVDPLNTIVDFVVFQFSVIWTDNQTGLSGTLATSTKEQIIASVQIDSAGTFKDFVDFEVVIGGAGFNASGVRIDASDASNTINPGTAVTVYVKVTLLLPADVVGTGTAEEPQYTAQQVYTAIATKAITFTVDFTVTVD